MKSRLGIEHEELLKTFELQEESMSRAEKDYVKTFDKKSIESKRWFVSHFSEDIKFSADKSLPRHTKRTQISEYEMSKYMEKYKVISQKKKVLEWASSIVVSIILSKLNSEMVSLPRHDLILDNDLNPVALMTPWMENLSSSQDLMENYYGDVRMKKLRESQCPLEHFSTLLLLPGLIDMPDLFSNIFLTSNKTWLLTDLERAFNQFHYFEGLITTLSEMEDVVNDHQKGLSQDYDGWRSW